MMPPTYQVWIRDAHLAGHIVMEDGDTEEEALEFACGYARDVWSRDVVDNDVSVCRIPDGYYQEMAQSTAKDSIAWGM